MADIPLWLVSVVWSVLLVWAVLMLLVQLGVLLKKLNDLNEEEDENKE
ncbi:MAG: hypothetical protein KBA03_03655 [Anaerolineaceae bacterium]|nr:hypothetical protein [Anaerolineaceae bacterium]